MKTKIHESETKKISCDEKAARKQVKTNEKARKRNFASFRASNPRKKVQKGESSRNNKKSFFCCKELFFVQTENVICFYLY